MPLLIGRKAPDFAAPALLSSGMLVERHHFYTVIRGSYALLFFDPLALTMPCASELTALDRRSDEFRRRSVRILGVTLDAQCQYSIWRNIPADNLRPLSFPLIIDNSRTICHDYGLARSGCGFASRAAFLIDRKGVVRYQAINDLPLGQEIDDLLRLVDAINGQGTRVSPKPRRDPSSSTSNRRVTAREKVWGEFV